MRVTTFVRGSIVGAVLLAAVGCGSVSGGDGDDGGDDDGTRNDGSPSGDDGGQDAAPGSPVITSVEPEQLFENQGSGSGARAIPIVVAGEGFAAGAVLTADPADALLFEGPTAVSADGTLAARVARVPLDETAGIGATEEVTLILTQGDVTATGSIDVAGLDELTIDSLEIDVSTLAEQYARIAITTSVRLNGTISARLVATGDISVQASVSARSGSCRGGFGRETVGDDGSCGTGGGRGGLGGGGGGGNATVGQPGTGSGGAGGEITGNAMLVPLGGVDGTRGNGGGGGGGGNEGASGGSGGGIVELSAGGRVVIEAEIDADGVDGSDGDASAGGGGGSGGVILLRSAGDIAISAPVHATGGVGGQGEGTSPDGGAGGTGRIRIDTPVAQLPGGISPAAARGPMWTPSNPVIVSDETAALTFIGGNRTYFISVAGGDLFAAPVPGGGGVSTVDVPLSPGLNAVCAHVVDDGGADLPEAKNCISVARIPE